MLTRGEHGAVVVLTEEPGARSRNDTELKQVVILQSSVGGREGRFEYPNRAPPLRSAPVLDNQPNGGGGWAQLEKNVRLVGFG